VRIKTSSPAGVSGELTLREEEEGEGDQRPKSHDQHDCRLSEPERQGKWVSVLPTNVHGPATMREERDTVRKAGTAERRVGLY
jgi:hypothetical protein